MSIAKIVAELVKSGHEDLADEMLGVSRASRITADSPDIGHITSAISNISGVSNATKVDSWKESEGIYWYNVHILLEVVKKDHVHTHSNSPMITKTTEFKTKPIVVAKAVENIVKKAGGWQIKVNTPKRKKAWVDKTFGPATDTKAYYDDDVVAVEFLWEPGASKASVVTADFTR